MWASIPSIPGTGRRRRPHRHHQGCRWPTRRRSSGPRPLSCGRKTSFTRWRSGRQPCSAGWRAVRALADAYATAFKLDLDTRIVAATGRLDFIKRQMTLADAPRTPGSRSWRRTAMPRAPPPMPRRRWSPICSARLIELQGELDRSNLRRRAAEQGTLLLDDGTDAAIAARRLDNARLDLTQTETEIVVRQSRCRLRPQHPGGGQGHL